MFFKRHTGALMFATTRNFLEALYPHWKETPLTFSSDGDRLRTGRIQGLLTRIDSVTDPGIIHVWYRLHKLNFVIKKVYKKSLDEAFMGTWTCLVFHLWCQQNLIQEMKRTCPKEATTRWVSMQSCSRWITTNIVQLGEHLDYKATRWAPTPLWCTFFFAVHSFSAEVRNVFTL